jgi:integral membrane sensor domain MASE1
MLHGQYQRSAADDLARRWINSVGLAVAIGLVYFLAARLSVGLLLPPEGVAVFWPAAGVSSGVLIALGPRARWPVAAGVTAATVVIHQLIADPLWAGIALGLSNAAEALIVAGLLEFPASTARGHGSKSCWRGPGRDCAQLCVSHSTISRLHG